MFPESAKTFCKKKINEENVATSQVVTYAMGLTCSSQKG